MQTTFNESIAAAAAALAEAQGLVIGAGAGMGVDSGLPDFRGNEGFWRAYPPFAKAGLSFVDMANPAWFERDPKLAWGFYGHRMMLYRSTTPHPGFEILRRFAEKLRHAAFVFTSNVDGQFQRAGFDPARIVECHGSIHHFQCAAGCRDAIWSAATCSVTVDESSFRAVPPLPLCDACGQIARPNVLMFGDWRWVSLRTQRQEAAYDSWLRSIGRDRIVIIEIGAGSAVPTVRWHCERLAKSLGAPLIRINPREPEGPGGTIGIPLGALDALRRIENRETPA